MADATSVGTIQLDVEVNPQSLNRELNRMNEAFNNNFKNMFSSAVGQTNNFVKNSINKLTSGFKGFEKSGTDSNQKVAQSVNKVNSQYEKTQKKIKEIDAELNKVYASMDAIAAGYAGLPAFSGMTKGESIERLLGTDVEYQKLSQEAEKLELKLEPLTAKSKELSEAMNQSGAATQETSREFSLMKGIMSGVNTTLKGLGKGFKKLGSTIMRLSDTVLKKFTTSIMKFSGMSRIFSRETNKASSASSNFGNSMKRVSRMIARNIVVYGLIIKGLKSMMSYMWSALKTNEQFSHSLNIIKTNLLVAFQPIYEFILPALNALMQAIATVTTYIAAAISALFGKTYKQSFVAAKSMNTAINSMGGASKATKGLGKAAKKAGKDIKGALAPFDEINQLMTQSAEAADEIPDVGGIPSGTPSGFEMTMPDLATIDIGDPYTLGKNIAEWIARGLASINWTNIKKHAANIGRNIALFINGGVETPELWYQIGRTVREGLNTVATFAESFADTLNWSGLGKSLADGLNSAIKYWDPNLAGRAIYKNLNGIREVIYNFFTKTNWSAYGKKFTEGLNTIVTGLDMNMIGRSFASKWNALVDFMYEIVTDFDWVNLGLQLSIGVNSWFDEIDWAKAATTLSNGIKGVFEFVNTFIMETDWFKIGESLAIIIANIDWGGITFLLFQGIGAALGGLAQFIWGLISDAWQSVVDWWADVAFEDGKFTMAGLLRGILEGIKNIGTWIKDNIFKPFIDGFKSAFGIHSPSTVMHEMGISLIQGLMNGIKELIGKIPEIFINLRNEISGIWDSTKKKAEEIWGSIKTAITTPIKLAKDLVSKLMSSLKENILNRWGQIRTGIGNMKNKLKEAMLAPFKLVKNPIGNIIKDAKNWGKNLIGNFTDGINAMKNKVKDAAKGVAGGVKDFLGFSSPAKKGPGADADKWMPNLMGMLADGIQDNIYEVSAAVNMTAGTIQQGMTIDTGDLAMAVGTAVGGAVSQAIQTSPSSGGDGDIVLKIGETEFGRIAISAINTEQRRVGKTLLIV